MARHAKYPAQPQRYPDNVVSLPAGCRWIEGDPRRAYSFCGAPQQPDSSYCPEHHRRVFLKLDPKLEKL